MRFVSDRFQTEFPNTCSIMFFICDCLGSKCRICLDKHLNIEKLHFIWWHFLDNNRPFVTSRGLPLRRPWVVAVNTLVFEVFRCFFLPLMSISPIWRFLKKIDHVALWCLLSRSNVYGWILYVSKFWGKILWCRWRCEEGLKVENLGVGIEG